LPAAPHAAPLTEILAGLETSPHGLSLTEVAARRARCGANTLPRDRPPGVVALFLRQFASPLIYVLCVAAVLSLFIGEGTDAAFIFAVLLINAVIGTLQEFSAQRAAGALQRLVTVTCRVLREGESFEIDAEELVPGDIILLESGDRVPADARLIESRDLETDESLLTGESLAVRKDAAASLPLEAALGDRRNMVYAGSLVMRGRARAVVVATATHTELGRLATAVLTGPAAKAPLILRMEKFTRWVAALVGLAAVALAAVALVRGMPWEEIFFLAVALAVSAIPEGLPVALTVALAIGMSRMARRNVIVRRLVAVEALGSCTFIATDKTGTLTVNQLTVRRIAFPSAGACSGSSPDSSPAASSGEGGTAMVEWEVSGEGAVPEGVVQTPRGVPAGGEEALLERLCRAAVLPNEAFLGRRDGGRWVHHGDAVDVALLVLAHKAGITREEALNAFPQEALIPFESERLFAASLNRVEGTCRVFVKGALERILPMCRFMATPSGEVPLDEAAVTARAQALAEAGYRVLALADGPVAGESRRSFDAERLEGLTLIGLVGMIDPLRVEAKGAIARCRQAGIEVAMVTGDHPATALAIARQLELVRDETEVVGGPRLKTVRDEAELDELTRKARVFARVEPAQKLQIVRSLQRNGHFVAVTGDGANDAPALRAAQVGVAMGRSGTDVAREAAELILTDDNFASIVAGVEEGRIAYGNVRKVIFLLISTGAAELVLFALALATGLPLPLLAVQLLWLNLVTNGIQDVALAFEPGEGRELQRPPRPPGEPIFDRLMVERVLVSALVMGGLAFLLFRWLLAAGYTVDEARNGTLLLMVLFENVHVFNSRSETLSAFRHNPLRNPILLFGTVAAQLVHIGAMYTPGLRDVLGIQPVTPQQWLQLLLLALTVLAAMELHKWVWHARQKAERG